ncbi:MAG: hypothetical protein PW843_25530 [Azospirillaceae bacterium]|nr:hypothetical protein [Azospirillaceae bacterium]
MLYPDALAPIVAFLRGIGFTVEFGPGAAGGFLPGVNIQGGAIHIDPDTLVSPGDLLHEAGHMAILPRRLHARLGRDLEADTIAAVAAEAGPGMPADPVLAAPLQQGEFMAQAWSYAAALHLDVPPECVFFPGSYHIDAYEGTHPMQVWLEAGTHHGLGALAKVGMTGYAGIFALMHDNGLAPFPHMNRWIQM